VRKSFVASVLALALSAGQAGAGDTPMRWEGFYIGAHAGGVWTRNQVTDTGFQISETIRASSAIGGALLGYNFSFGNWISGFELDIGFANARASDDVFDIQSKLIWSGNARLRFGYAVDRTLFFVAGGVSAAKLDQTAFPNLVGLAKQNYYPLGLTIGGGVETFVAQNWLFRVEYLYTAYDVFEQTYSLPGQQVPSTLDTHIVRAALIYKFGDGKPTQPIRTSGTASWSGAYIGAHAGQTKMRSSHEFNLGGIVAYEGSIRESGFFGGALAGLNHQFGNWVFGFEADFGIGPLNGFDELIVETRLRWDAHIRARIGHAFDRYLIFVTTGVALAQFQQSVQGENNSTKLFTGLTYGGGIDTMLAPNFIFRVEYLYSKFETTTLLHTNAGFILDNELNTSTVRAAIIYKYAGGSFIPTMPRTRPMTAFSWNGAYVGLHGGHQQLRQFFSDSFESDTFDADGFNGGFLAGLNIQQGNWVFGIEADAGLSSGTSIRRLSACLCDEVESKAIWDSHWRVRAGYAVDRYLAFVAAGLAVGEFSQAPSLDSKVKRTHLGFTIGAGIDVMLANNLLFRFEYLFSDYDLRNYSFISTGGSITDTENRIHTIRAAAIYRFH